ncbi:pirin family protein [Brevibacillus choshinensis]|uniref:Pirin family protein n=1 Tax=Brevibacillus choshinensis TaxID=54911 RepID=A0ABX7FVE2_BRECH|nr:pirin family protein [Brevibacillus choshinensis]QRG69504.1 pirin family protein [Brevibacillus choshinensis]
MIDVRKAGSRYSADHGWLKSNFSFSFADYYDPDNMGFGPLRVFNDDTVAPQMGFGSHPHREMEIVSIVLQGQLGHQDSTGRQEVVQPGEVQRMSAGTGIIHSEMNPSATEEVKFLQLWFEPAQYGLVPSYEQKAYDPAKLRNQLLPVVSPVGGEEIAKIHQDLTLYLSRLDAGETIHFQQSEKRRTYLFVMEGELSVNSEATLETRDAARITSTTSLAITASSSAYFMLIDLP